MTAYNSEEYIAQAIESILEQTYKDFEFIIINDGSTDRTSDVVGKYAKTDKRIKFIDNKVNQGLIAVLNQGLDMCAGEYIARMDSDDISIPERFALQIEYMDKNPHVAVVGGWHEKFGTNIRRTVRRYPAQTTLLDSLLQGTPISHPTAMIRRKVLDAHNIRYNSDYKHAEDYQFWTQIVQVGEIHNLQKVLLYYRWHDTNVSVLSRNIQLKNSERIRADIIKKLTHKTRIANKLYEMSEETIRSFRLFGLLPIIRRKQYGITKTKYYLFGKIPFILVQNYKIYLFEFIKIGVLK